MEVKGESDETGEVGEVPQWSRCRIPSDELKSNSRGHPNSVKVRDGRLKLGRIRIIYLIQSELCK